MVSGAPEDERAAAPTQEDPVTVSVVRPSWSTWREALSVLAYRPHLGKTVRVALVVGTVLFAINQLDVVLRHQASAATYLKGVLTYLVPFCVSNYGILVATRVPAGGRL